MTAGPLEVLADDVETLTAHLTALWAAQSVCQAVATHRDTPPRDAAGAWLLGRWIGEGP